MLCERRAHQQSAVAAALDGQPGGAGVLVIDEVSSACSEIIEHILFFRELPLLVPRFAEFAAAAKIGNRVDASVIEPNAALHSEARLQTDVVPAVSAEVRRICSVELPILAMNDVQPHFGAG